MVATTRDRLAARVQWYRARRLTRREVWRQAGGNHARFRALMRAELDR